MADNEILFRIKVVDEGGKPLPTTIPPEVMASAGGDYVIAFSDDIVMTLS